MPSPASFSVTLFALLAVTAGAAPLSQTQPVDFYADVTSRSLQGIATRSDGRLVPGPAVTETGVKFNTGLLWALATDGDHLLIGTGPDGQLLRVNPNQRGEITPEVLVDLPETHVFAVLRLPNGDVLAGTSPQGTLVLVRDGQVTARAALPVDSIFDLSLYSADADRPAVLVATGNPGRIYRVDLTAFSAGGDQPDKLTTPTALADRGITLFGEIRDRNVRRILPLADGRVIAGSAPKGNVYAFDAAGGTPRLLAEHRNAEVCDLLAWDGGFFAALTFASTPGEARMNRPRPAPTPEAATPPVEGQAETPALPPVPAGEPPRLERFPGRGQLLWFPDGGFPETTAARSGIAFYRLARHGDLVLIAGGEQGDLLGYDPKAQRSLTFPGALASSQLNGLVPAAKVPGGFYALGNNSPTLALVNFPGATTRSAESRRIDLGLPADLGALRFGAATRLAPGDLTVELRTSFGSDEVEGWTDWQRATPADDGWTVPGLRGRHVQIRVTPQSSGFTLDKAELHYLPQNRRPQLQDFRLLSPNYGLVPAVEQPGPAVQTLGQLMQPAGRDEDKRRNPLLSSQVAPQPGAQVVFWNVNDPDGDTLASTFALRRVGDDSWTELIRDTSNSYLQFDISHLPEGVYETRLVTRETAPRPAGDRLAATFEADDLVVDRSAPEIVSVEARRESDRLLVRVRARDRLSLLAALELTLNNGFTQLVEQPADGILDGREETFTVEIPAAQAAGATTLEVIIYDAAGNHAARRVPCP